MREMNLHVNRATGRGGVVIVFTLTGRVGVQAVRVGVHWIYIRPSAPAFCLQMCLVLFYDKAHERPEEQAYSIASCHILRQGDRIFLRLFLI